MSVADVPRADPLGGACGVLPTRVPLARGADAARALARDGAVVLTGAEVTADALVVAAATVLGARLRELYPLRERASRDGGPVHLHADGLDFVVDVGGVPTRRRHPDEDHVLVQSVRPAPSGGASLVLDAYRLVDRLAEEDPELHAFLTTVDVDLYGAWAGLRGLPALPRVARHVEFTRAGRRVVRRTDGAVPLRRDPREGYVREMLARFEARVHGLEASLPRLSLARGEILLLDNYRCWHGRDPHEGERSVRILTLRGEDAR
ncbi:gamma-butyrobetaine dioxygenase [Streptomyces zhaozhouensis]|uniref:Gamma-butyrobetaine dioxygenase n=1 Tax=Streptomyces zhaozhouensis TaxID=1300267 RepID=A0A286DWA9_9ACTN|nr:TauD/TfdA family dioxygenase [Streptomyces zhaozhouensis]SOD62967.1 gamma-butyrobetaine dioxygenase [Streptomyces zhaozhouensis]